MFEREKIQKVKPSRPKKRQQPSDVGGRGADFIYYALKADDDATVNFKIAFTKR